MADTIVVVGASVAGVRTVQALRRRGYVGRIVLIGEEPHHPYDKPPLSKDMLGGTCEPVPLLTPETLAGLDLGLRLGVRATALDAAARLVHTADGGTVSYDELVVATGVVPRVLPGTESVAGVHTLRTADDARALDAALTGGTCLAVIGAGFIGAEVASSAVARGVDVTIVEAQPIPMANLLGAEVGTELARLHDEHGVRTVTGARVEKVDPGGTGVQLADGTVLPADVVVVGIGASPATGWLRSSGLPVDDGVDCGPDLRVRGHEHVWAAGDVARWHHPLYDAPLRIEHWTNAGEHGEIVAAGILGQPAPKAQVPYVWSDQYGRRIQIVGRPQAGELAEVRGGVAATAERPLVAVYAGADGEVAAALVVDDPRLLMTLRRAVGKRASVEDTVAALPVTASI